MRSAPGSFIRRPRPGSACRSLCLFKGTPPGQAGLDPSASDVVTCVEPEPKPTASPGKACFGPTPRVGARERSSAFGGTGCTRGSSCRIRPVWSRSSPARITPGVRSGRIGLRLGVRCEWCGVAGRVAYRMPPRTRRTGPRGAEIDARAILIPPPPSRAPGPRVRRRFRRAVRSRERRRCGDGGVPARRDCRGAGVRPVASTRNTRHRHVPAPPQPRGRRVPASRQRRKAEVAGLTERRG